MSTDLPSLSQTGSIPASVSIDEGGETATLTDVTDDDSTRLQQLDSDSVLDVEFVDESTALITSTNYAGLIALPSGRQIHIRPKVTGTTLLHLLQYADEIDFEMGAEKTRVKEGSSYVELLATLFLGELQAILQQGVDQTYRSVERTEDYIRGRFDLHRQLQKHGPGAPQFECSYDELTQDTLLNQAVLFAGWTLLGLVDERSLQRQLRQHVMRLRRTVTLREVKTPEVQSVSLTRLNDHYTDLFRITKLILNSVQIEDIAPGESAAYSMQLYMPDQFEQAVGNAVTAALDSSVYAVDTSPTYDFLEGDFSQQLEPDVVVTRNRAPVLVLDAKWKTDETATTPTPSREDIYQLTAYMQYTQTPGIIVYPGPPTVAEARVKHGASLSTIGLPVATDTDDFATYRRQLDEALEDILKETIASGRRNNETEHPVEKSGDQA